MNDIILKKIYDEYIGSKCFESEQVINTLRHCQKMIGKKQ